LEFTKQLLGLLGDQPNIQVKIYQNKGKSINNHGDEDIIRNKHSLEMYENIEKAQLCIMPGETHFASNPKLFNEIVNRFFRKTI
jgi:hypothetical protein